MPNTDGQLKMYPRGFLGGEVNAQLERTTNSYAEKLKQLHYTVNQSNAVKAGLVANPHVEALYATLIKNNVKIGDPQFRTSILLCALNAFGTRNFVIWFLSQYSSPACGDMHNRFLLDTLKFISTGVRSMSLENWAALLQITDEGDRIGKPPEKAKEFFGINKYEEFNRANSNVTMIDVIQNWCSKSNGLEDLIGTMHILFGNP